MKRSSLFFRTRYVLQWVKIVQAGDALIIDPWYNNSNAMYVKRVYEAAFPLPSDESPVETTEEQAGVLHATAGMPYENPVPSGCMSGEVVVALTGVDGQFCSPACSATAACPTNPCE